MKQIKRKATFISFFYIFVFIKRRTNLFILRRQNQYLTIKSLNKYVLFSHNTSARERIWGVSTQIIFS